MAKKTFQPISGSGTHVVLEFPNLPPLHMGSLITISYNVYRDKTPVFNCGQPTVDGFAIGNKYVAGSLITAMFKEDEFSKFMEEYDEYYKNTVDGNTLINLSGHLKEVHTRMKDDLTSFNVHIIFTSEYTKDASRIILYDVNLVSNGQVMSIEDMATESTHQFVAKDIREQHNITNDIRSIDQSIRFKKGSAVIRRKRKFNDPDIVSPETRGIDLVSDIS